MHTKVLEINVTLIIISSTVYEFRSHLQWISIQFMRFGYKCLFTLIEKALMCKKMDRILFHQKKLLRTSSRVHLCSFMIFPQNHKKPLRKPNIQQNHFQTKPNFGLQNPEKTVHSTPLIKPPSNPRKEKQTHDLSNVFSTTTTSQLPNFPTRSVAKMSRH